MIDLKNILPSISTTPTKDLIKLVKAVEVELLEREKFVEYIPNICDKDTLISIWSECKALKLPDNSRKSSSQWLCPVNIPYIYPDTNPVHNPVDITLFPGISKLLDQLNSDSRFVGPLESCLVLKYSSNSASLSPHADDEVCMDQLKSICNFSIGATHTLEFFEKYGNKPGAAGKAVKSVEMENNSVVHMKPGTQQILKHMVRKAEPLQDNRDEQRFSLSFRSLAAFRKSSAPDFSPRSSDSSIIDERSTPVTEQRAVNKQHICLIIGDSYAAKLDVKRLGKGYLCAKNIATGGAKIDQVTKQLVDYIESNPDVIVDKLLVSVGTNDIRYCKEGINHLRGPLKLCCTKIKELCPNSRVYFQNLLPLPCLNLYDWNTNTNVLEFNRLIFNECGYRKFHCMNAFEKFAMPCYNRWCPHIRRDDLFEEKGIHPSPERGVRCIS